MIVWRIRRKIIRTVLCCVVYDSCAQRYARTYEQFLKLSVGLGLGLVCVHLFRFSILCFSGLAWTICSSCVVCFAVLGLVSSLLSQEIGWDERLRNYLFYV